MTTQAKASVVRQILAVLASVYGVVSTQVSSLHLPPAVAAILTAVGPIILAIEHFVADPSTGTAQTVVTAADAIPEVNKLIAEAKTEIARFTNDAKVFLEPAPVPTAAPGVPAPAPTTPPVAPTA